MATDQMRALHDIRMLAYGDKAPGKERATTEEWLPGQWETHLSGENCSRATIYNYLRAVYRFTKYREAQGLSLDVTTVKPMEVSTYLTYVRNLTPKGDVSARTAYAQLLQFFRYVKGLGVIDASPMAKMGPPSMQDRVPPLPDTEAVSAVLAVCAKGKSFADIRDYALLRVIRTTGLRAAETAGMTVENVDIRKRAILVLGKGGRERGIYLTDPKTFSAFYKYMLDRSGHKYADKPQVWLGARGPMTPWGILPASPEAL